MKIRNLPCLCLLCGVMLLLLLSSCWREDVPGVRSGDLVSFTVRSGGSFDTRTSYSGVRGTGDKERIDWQEGDRFTVASLQTDPSSATYRIPSADSIKSDGVRSIATGVVPVSGGLSWGTGVHRFYGVYPEVADTPSDIMSLSVLADGASDKGVISAKIPAVQTFSDDSTSTAGDMRYLIPSRRFPYMWSAASTAAEEDFTLVFTPMVTAFQFTVGGDGTNTDDIEITGFELESGTCALAGADAYVTTVSPSGSSFTAEYTTYVDRKTGPDANSSVSFTMPSGAGKVPVVSSSKQLRFMVFVYPFGREGFRNVLDGLTVKFTTSVGNRALELKYGDGAGSDAGKWVEFPAGCKINISGLQLPEQLDPWRYSAEAGDWADELPDVVVSPVKVTEFKREGIVMQDDSQYILEGTVPATQQVIPAGGTVTFATAFRSCKVAGSASEKVSFIFQYSATGAEGTWTDGLPDWLSVPSTVDQGGYITATTLSLTAGALAAYSPDRSTYIRIRQPASGGTTSACQITQNGLNYILEGTVPAAQSVAAEITVTFATNFLSCLDNGITTSKEAFDFQYSTTGADDSWTNGLPDWLEPAVGTDQTGATSANTIKLKVLARPAWNSSARSIHVRIKQTNSGKTTPACQITQDRAYFSVSDTKRVIFSPGNLVVTYHSNGIHDWAFEQNQYDYSYGTDAGESYAGMSNYQTEGTRISHFGWGTSGLGTARPPYEISSDDNLYTWSDWGIHFDENGNGLNSRTNGTYWYTLSYEEWMYLSNRSDLLVGMSSYYHVQIFVESENRIVYGRMFLPDNWQTPDGCSLGAVNGFTTRYTTGAPHVSYPNGSWITMEKAGAVLLPSAGARLSNWRFWNNEAYTSGYYWTRDGSGSDKAISYGVGPAGIGPNGRSNGISVRLVRDIINP